MARYSWRKTNTAFQKNTTILALKCGGGVKVWGVTAMGLGRLTAVGVTMNSSFYQKILKENVCPSVHDLKLKHIWLMQQ